MRVDGTTYCILGQICNYYLSSPYEGDTTLITVPLNPTNVTNRVITPTQITLTVEAGPMQVNVTFFNPVEVLFESYKS